MLRPQGGGWAEICGLGHADTSVLLLAVGHEIRPGCLKVVAYVESKLLADALAKRLGDD
jgi:hypothetical protein